MFFSSSSLSQLSSSQLPFLLWLLLLFLLSELHTQFNVTLPLLLLMSLLHFLPLFFKHFSIILGDVGGNGERYSDTEEKAKTFLFCLYIVDLGTITEFLDKFNKTLKAQS